MKIGEFASKNKVSKDTIRYYMDLGLIIPEKQGGQYFFDDRCQNKLDEIFNLKNMAFTLNEIKTIFVFRLLGNLTPYQQNEYYKTLFVNKHEEILNRIENLTAIGGVLKNKIKDLSQYECDKKFTWGINVNMLNIFNCPKCNGQFVIQDGIIKDNEIINGKLKCRCGKEYIIENGILIANNCNNESQFNFDFNYITEYINVTDYNYLDNIYKGIDWVHKKIDFSDLKNKVLLELGSGFGFALRSNYNKLPNDCIYVAVDHDITRHKFLKNMLEMADIKKNVVFICADFLEMPIKHKSIDILLDFSGTSNYSFEHDEFLLALIDKYVKENAYIIGSYILFKNFNNNSLIAERFRNNFILNKVKQEIAELKYKVIDERVSNYVENGGKYEDYFVNGEKIYNYAFYGKR
ncbi:MerR family transcriptional regulator [Clostridium sp. 'deep sea']|uniref:MerR family transcriptional regulator n=1 Tax=Clostridium sp. 'deep sea' TaxID=2779445 RepID=UPI00189682C0|nr:MerR family transcriptional regulator [Clostridium sp. 'deep sea']QOR34229.1 MerR family transcriptional regulator [Clostridium sp. 'deep sea']